MAEDWRWSERGDWRRRPWGFHPHEQRKLERGERGGPYDQWAEEEDEEHRRPPPRATGNTPRGFERAPLPGRHRPDWAEHGPRHRDRAIPDQSRAGDVEGEHKGFGSPYGYDFAEEAPEPRWETMRGTLWSHAGGPAEAQEGPYRGRGPRNYRRTDEHILNDVGERLYMNSWLDASDIEVAVENGEVTLSGFVDSRASKRRAEDIADSVPGVAHVQNNLRLRPRDRAPQPQ